MSAGKEVGLKNPRERAAALQRDFQFWAWAGGRASAGFRAAYLAVGWMGVLHVLAMPGSGRGRVDGLCR